MLNPKFNEAKERLINSAQRVAGAYLLSKYGSAHLSGEPKVELTATEGATSSSFVFSGSITCFAADGLLNQVGVNMTVNDNDIEVTSEDIQANITDALNAAEEQTTEVVAALDGFKLTDDGTKYLKVSHSDLQDANLGIVGKNEYNNSPDRAELLQNIVKDAMLETPITFTGEFKEPTIEKAAIVKQAASDTHEHNCKECGNMWKCHKGQACNEGKNAPCGKCYAKEEFGAKKSSWLTADLFKEASVEKKADDDDYCSECEKPLQFGGICESCKRDLENDAEASLKTIAIKEDMPMARAHDSMAHLAQSEEQSSLEAQLKVEHEAANQLMSLLQGMGYGSSAKIVESSYNSNGIDFMTAIDDRGAVKAVSIPVSIKEGKIILPKKSLISTLISKGLDVHAKLVEQFDLEVLEKLAAIDEKLAYESHEVENILNEKQASVEKAAAGEKQPFFDSDDSTMTVQKHLLPDHESLKEGDRLSDGVDQYEIVNTSGSQNSKGEGDSSLWTLKKCQDPERDDKKVKNQIPS